LCEIDDAVVSVQYYVTAYDSCQRDCIRATQDAAIQPNSLALVKGGQLKLLGVATSKRMAALPEVPTIAETLAGFESAAWFAIVAPPKTPPAIVDKINADVNEALREDDIRQRLAQLSAEPIGGTPQATAAYMREEVERWHKVIKAANVKLD
jgi:tripartite-type tricarboxylate transporter receptor subunit TctC